MKTVFHFLLFFLTTVLCAPGYADSFITLQSTTSTENSGLYENILPLFEAQSGIRVRVVAVGTGQAIKNAKNGDGDVILVHAKSAEEAFVDQGYGIERFDVMYNDFVVVGPVENPAQLTGEESVVSAFKKIASSQSIFVSRGDDSGTHRKELELWREANIDPLPHSGKWYRESGSGMGTTLNAAIAMNGYVLTDRGTWISYKNKQNSIIHVQGDSNLFNQYGVILVNPSLHPHVKAEQGQLFLDWILGSEGQSAIENYRLDGVQLFFPNANRETTD